MRVNVSLACLMIKQNEIKTITAFFRYHSQIGSRPHFRECEYNEIMKGL